MSFKERFKEVRLDNGLTQAGLAESLGVKQKTISNWESGRNEPDLNTLITVSHKWDVDLNWLLTGEGLKGEDSEQVHVPELDICFAAGHGAYPDDHILQVGKRPFNKQWIEAKGLKVKNLYLVRVAGDSMEPLLKDKDTIMIDRSKVAPSDAFPFAVRVEDCLYIKRLYKQGKVLTLNSVNSLYPPITVDLEATDCEILGAVVWHAHSWV